MTRIRILAIAAMTFCGTAIAGPVTGSETSMVEHAKVMVKMNQPKKTEKVKGHSVKAPSLELVRSHFDSAQIDSELSRTVSKQKRSLTVDRTKSATLIRLGDASRPGAKKPTP